VTKDGEQVGVLERSEALALAKEQNVDLVEISPKTNPPVCRLIDYGKMLYGLKKKERQNKKNQKKIEQKGIRISFSIGPGDLERKQKEAGSFLSEGHSIRLQMIMKGREKAHKNLALEKINNFISSLEKVAKVDQPARLSGFQYIAILKPIK